MPCPCPSKKRSLFVLVAAAVGAATAISVMRSRSAKKAALPDVPTVDHVVPERYVGTWYEIARLPNWFQTKCSRNNKAEYTLTVDGMQVRNSCTRSDGSTVTTTGVAKVVPGSGNAKWRVSFLRPFYSAYWILALDPDYEWALVGTPDRQCLWILARAPHLPQEVLRQLIERAQELGFATETLAMTEQAVQADVLYPRSYGKKA